MDKSLAADFARRVDVQRYAYPWPEAGFDGPHLCDRLAAHHTEAVSRTFSRLGGTEMLFIMYGQYDPVEKTRGRYTFVATTSRGAPEDDRTKDALEIAVRHVLMHCEPLALVTIAEAWTVMGAEVSEAQIQRGLEHHPKRLEIVYVTLETAGESQLWTAPVIRVGRPHLGKFERLSGWEHSEGRFANLLKRSPRVVEA